MAKATAPLFSIAATGAFAKTLVFDRRGYVRQYVIPANPKTDDQASIRAPFAGVAAVIKNISPNAKDDLKAKLEEQGKPTYRWNAELIKAALEDDGWNRRAAAYRHYSADAQTAWNDQAQNHGVNPQPLPYGTPPTNYPGVSVFVVAQTFYEMGIGLSEAPNDTNAEDWSNYLLRPTH